MKDVVILVAGCFFTITVMTAIAVATGEVEPREDFGAQLAEVVKEAARDVWECLK